MAHATRCDAASRTLIFTLGYVAVIAMFVELIK
jgi:hypothetical protein